MAPGEKPNYLVVARSILVGAIAAFGMKYLWDIMLETWPSHPEIIKLLVLVIAGFIIAKYSMKPIMNEFGQNWR
jgi:hypothetical protein